MTYSDIISVTTSIKKSVASDGAISQVSTPAQAPQAATEPKPTYKLSEASVKLEVKGVVKRQDIIELIAYSKEKKLTMDLSYLDFSLTDLSSLDLGHANFADAFLKGTILTKSNLDHANLEKAYMAGAKMDFVSMDGTNLRGTNLMNCNLSSATITNCFMDGETDLMRADLSEAKLSKIEGIGRAKNLKGIHSIDRIDADLPTLDLLREAKGMSGLLKNRPDYGCEEEEPEIEELLPELEPKGGKRAGAGKKPPMPKAPAPISPEAKTDNIKSEKPSRPRETTFAKGRAKTSKGTISNKSAVQTATIAEVTRPSMTPDQYNQLLRRLKEQGGRVL